MAENIHDRFFKENFSRQDIAIDFVREFFPKHLVGKINLDTLTITNNSYTDPALDEYFADIVYTCNYQGETTIEVAILFEHKSYKEKYPHFQLLRYLLNRWEEARKQDQPLTLLIPVIIYHGKARWPYESLPTYFGSVDANLMPFLPAFDYLLVDISRYPDEQILNFQNKFLATSLFLMKHRENEERLLAQKERLFVWLEEIIDTETGENYLHTSIVYLSRNLELRPKEFFQSLFSFKRTSSKVMSTYDQIVAEGAERTLVVLLKTAHQQGIDITRLANQDYGLSKERVATIVEKIKKGIL
ncbi:Rpn family recombination-promoting nuclease/putative transposase [Spirosoma soli]|uniref:Rpn family recombination-promoting nuclease/putative transposase n=1 Tax=Spirosoma soli TaxID=1770529 RepID=A0ABW5M1R3_9BACT